MNNSGPFGKCSRLLMVLFSCVTIVTCFSICDSQFWRFSLARCPLIDHFGPWWRLVGRLLFLFALVQCSWVFPLTVTLCLQIVHVGTSWDVQICLCFPIVPFVSMFDLSKLVYVNDFLLHFVYTSITLDHVWQFYMFWVFVNAGSLFMLFYGWNLIDL